MNKFVIPAILVSITLVAGIFAFMPVEKASTVHTTIQGTQLSEIDTVLDLDLKTNATATCGAGNTGLVHFVITNDTILGTSTTSVTVDTDGGGGAAGIIIELSENATSVSGTIGLDAGQTANFGFDAGGTQSPGDAFITVICQTDGNAVASAN